MDKNYLKLVKGVKNGKDKGAYKQVHKNQMPKVQE